MPRPKFWKLRPEDLHSIKVRDAWEANALVNALAAGGVRATIEGEMDPYGPALPPCVIVRKRDLKRVEKILDGLTHPSPGETTPPA